MRYSHETETPFCLQMKICHRAVLKPYIHYHFICLDSLFRFNGRFMQNNYIVLGEINTCYIRAIIANFNMSTVNIYSEY